MELLSIELNELSVTSWARSIDGYEFSLTIDHLGDFAARVTHKSSGLFVTGHGEHLSEVDSDLRMGLERLLAGAQGALTLGSREASVKAENEVLRATFLRHVHERLAQKATLDTIDLCGLTWTFKVPLYGGLATLQCTVQGDPYSKDAAWDVAHKVLSYLSKMPPQKGRMRKTPTPKWK